MLVGVIRDTAYIDGGYLWWTPGLADGTMATPLRDSKTTCSFRPLIPF